MILLVGGGLDALDVDALVQWEPRIDVERVEAAPDEENPNRVLVEIDYWVRETNSSANLVYPFYLNEGER